MPNFFPPYTLSECALYLLAINAITYFLFWNDKRLAKTNDWRTPEHVLLGAALFGGSPAAYFAMEHFRHKTKKASFRMRYWMVIIVQVGAAVYAALNPDVLSPLLANAAGSDSAY